MKKYGVTFPHKPTTFQRIYYYLKYLRCKKVKYVDSEVYPYTIDNDGNILKLNFDEFKPKISESNPNYWVGAGRRVAFSIIRVRCSFTTKHQTLFQKIKTRIIFYFYYEITRLFKKH